MNFASPGPLSSVVPLEAVWRPFGQSRGNLGRLGTLLGLPGHSWALLEALRGASGVLWGAFQATPTSETISGPGLPGVSQRSLAGCPGYFSSGDP